MNTIEIALLHHIVINNDFAQYITQRIDIGDVDDPITNIVYDAIICTGNPLSLDMLYTYFTKKQTVLNTLDLIANYLI